MASNLYTPEGILDYAEAARQLGNLRELGNAAAKTEATQVITAAALVDIAVSLNAVVAGFTTDDTVGDDGDAAEERERGEVDTVVIEPADDLEAGDWVQPWPIDYDDATQLDKPSLVLAVGVSEGAAWVELEHYDDDGSVLSSGVRSWAENYRRVPGPDAAGEAESDIDPHDLVDDIDSDFGESTRDGTEGKPVKVKSGKGKSKSKGGE